MGRKTQIMMLEGKVAIVTGAGGGIGREIAIAMASAEQVCLRKGTSGTRSGHPNRHQPPQFLREAEACRSQF
jgi:NAD(P)-dependent dehydrogenase (short-subunit alcohol dehydrogenase family)